MHRPRTSRTTRRSGGRYVLALLAGLTVFGSVSGMAASLGGLTTDTLGAESAIVAPCDSNGITVTYTTAYTNVAAGPGYVVSSVNFTGIDTACAGKTLKVELTDLANASVATQTVVLAAAPSTTATATWAGALRPTAKSVTGLHVVIS